MILFLADSMLGDVARKMRILGYDTEYDPGMDRGQVLRRAIVSGRTILTRNRILAGMAPRRGVRVIRVPVYDSMRHVMRQIGAAPRISPDTARCPVCNGVLAACSMPHDMPYDTRHDTQYDMGGHSFWRCTLCGHLYWEGSHMRNMREAAGKWR